MEKKKRKNLNTFLKRIFIMCLAVVVVTNVITYQVAKIKSANNVEEKYKKQEAEKAQQLKAEETEKKQKIKDESSLNLEDIDLSEIENVMIIAHPDDETIWGGNHILNGKYLIVCMTSGDNEIRKKEFEKTLSYTKDIGIMLQYPDNPNGVKDDWSNSKDGIKKDLRYLLTYKDWKNIVTHNPDGEYGHIQHKSTSFIVSSLCNELALTDKLTYFGKYYSAKTLSKQPLSDPLSKDDIDEKEKIMYDYYPSQKKAHSLFDHMIPYEKWLAFRDWVF